jgi:hypothetical protein
MRSKRIHFLADIDHWATKNHTSKPLQTQILDCFTKWANKTRTGLPNIEYKIGMEKITRGYIPAYWGHQQDEYRKCTRIKTSGALWARKLVKFSGQYNITIGKAMANKARHEQIMDNDDPQKGT